jgi:hypothetical protein
MAKNELAVAYFNQSSPPEAASPIQIPAVGFTLETSYALEPESLLRAGLAEHIARLRPIPSAFCPLGSTMGAVPVSRIENSVSQFIFCHRGRSRIFTLPLLSSYELIFMQKAGCAGLFANNLGGRVAGLAWLGPRHHPIADPFAKEGLRASPFGGEKASFMRFARENVMSPKELADEFEMSESRLADLRSQSKGPPYFKFGGIWYPKDEFDSWVMQQVQRGSDSGVTEEQERELALPVRVQGAGVHGKHRFGRHTTKHEGRRGDRDGGAEEIEARKTSGRAD